MTRAGHSGPGIPSARCRCEYSQVRERPGSSAKALLARLRRSHGKCSRQILDPGPLEAS